LKHVRDANPTHPGHNYVAHLLDDFTHVGVNGEHKCLVFNVMGERADDLSRRFDCRKIPVGLVKQIGRQILLGLDYLHTSCGIIHTGSCTISMPKSVMCWCTYSEIDIKPGNILMNLDNIEESVQHHLKRWQLNESSNSTAPHFESKTIVQEKLDSSASIHIRIVDFGVGTYECDDSVAYRKR
jgi:serine/threonine protein kinase